MPLHVRSLLVALSLGLALCVAPPAVARCIDDDNAEAKAAAEASEPPGSDAGSPRLALQRLVRTALQRSHAMGANKLLVEAAKLDLAEAQAAGKPQVSISGNLGGTAVTEDGVEAQRGPQARASLNTSGLIYDFGRTRKMTDWRRNLAEVARYGELSAQEQVGLQTVSLALERSRYKLQTQVYQQYARKMSCLVESLEQIVNADKGRASELVQARKTLQQAELQVEQSASSLRQIELRLRRFVGNELPGTAGMAAVLLQVPELNAVLADTERAADVAQQAAQTLAAESYAATVASANQPQINWAFGGSKAKGTGTAGASSVSAGINFNVPLLSPGSDAAAAAARKRAEAARLQQAETLEARKFRAAEVHEQAVAAFDRARRVVEVVRNSERFRAATLQQWQQLGRRSLFDVMSAESEHYALRVNYVNALFDGQQANAMLRSLGLGLAVWLE